MMLKIVALAALIGCTMAAHPSFSPSTHGWEVASSSVPSDSVAYLSVGVHLRDVPGLERFVLTVSDPTSPTYAQYLTLEEIAARFGPLPSTLKLVEQYFTGIGGVVDLSRSRDMMVVKIPHSTLASVLDVHFRVFRHSISGRTIVRTTDSVQWPFPSAVRSAVQIINGVDDFLDSVLERKSLVRAAAARHAKLVSAGGSSAPDIARCTGANRVFVVEMTLFCKDGLPAMSGSCSQGAPSPASVRVVASQRGFPSVTADYSLSELTALSELMYATPTLSLHHKFSRVNVSAVVTFTDGSTSPAGYLANLWSPSVWVTPQLLHAYHNVPVGFRAQNPNNSLAVGSFEQQWISNEDLTNYFNDHGLPQELPKIIGYNNQTVSAAGGEASLDIDMISGVGAGIPTTFWSVNGPGPTHGDMAYVLTWAYLVGNDTSPPLVTSLSYGDTEMGYFRKFGSFSYLERMDTELAKMAGRGLTVLAGSGDAGASNVGEAGNDISDTDPTCGPPFRPFYPSNSRYVVSVGASFFTADSTPMCSETITGYDLPLVCEDMGEAVVSVSGGMRWTSGGGFSNWTARSEAPWQNDAVNAYLAAHAADLPPSSYFNKSGRAYPDVVISGHNEVCRWAGRLIGIDGTSAAGPIMAAFVGLINEERLANHKAPVGLVTPLLYKLHSLLPHAFNDVTVGSIADGDLQPRGSKFATFCPHGFKAAPGYDVASGLGSPNIDIITQYALSLP